MTHPGVYGGGGGNQFQSRFSNDTYYCIDRGLDRILPHLTRTSDGTYAVRFPAHANGGPKRTASRMSPKKSRESVCGRKHLL